VLDTKEDYHVHASYNDHSAPDLTVKNALDTAEKLGLRTLAFTEHVRRSTTWASQYVQEVKLHSERSKMKVIIGFEAKILPDGSIDCLENYSRTYMIIASFHNVYQEKKIWMNALAKTIENPDVNVIGHLAPETTFSLNRTEVESIADKIVENEKIVEVNAKYHRPPGDWILIFKDKGVRFHLGSDAHSLSEIGQFRRVSDLISLAENG
jgi:histidinol phosphatase-like PHP family hydrolase